MRKFSLDIAFLWIAWAAFTPASAASLAATSVTVIAADPEAGDSANLAWEKTKAGKDSAAAAAEAARDPVYLVKVYMKLPASGSENYLLWVGDDEVREYGGFKHGIFFKVYDADLLSKWVGKPLRMAKRGQPPQALGVDFPDPEAQAKNRAGGSAARVKTKDALAD